MSPEQARGQAVDFRSDLFSFGIVLYEMTTGRSPFQGPSVTDTLSAIVRDQPAPMTRIAPGVPEELARITGKCLEKDADERYQHTDDLAMDLRKLRRVTDSQPLSTVSDTAVPAHADRPAWRRPVLLATAAIVVLAGVLGLAAWLRSAGVLFGGGPGNALAVLTFENLQDAEDSQRLGQILQELVITDLSELESLTVFSSQRLFDVQKQIGGGDGRQIDRSMATEVATRAGATTMLTGSLSQLGENWILTGQLVEVGSGRVIKSERIDGTDLYKMVDELTGRVRQDLRLSREEIAGVDRAVGERTTSSLEAYQRYLEGQELLARWDFEDAAKAFAEALAIDPEFGLARYKEAIAVWWQRGDLSEAGETPADILRDLVEGDYKLSGRERRLAEAMLAVVEDRYADAEPIFTALSRDYPDEKEAWYGLGEAYYHDPDGDREAAYAAFAKALALDPTFQLAWRHLRGKYRSEGHYREGIAKLRALLEGDPDNTGYYAEWITLAVMDGDVAGADRVLETALERIRDPDEQRELLMGAAGAYGALDLVDRRRDLLERALALDTDEKTDTVLADLGWHFLDLHDYREAEAHFLRALDLYPEGSGALDGLFRVYDEERRFADGILRARGLVQQDPEHLSFYLRWIDMAIDKGDEAETDRAIQAALDHTASGTEQQRVWFETGQSYRGIGDNIRALESYRQAREANPDGDLPPFLMGNRGWALMTLQRYEEAEEILRKAAETDSDLRNSTFSARVRTNIELRRFDEAQRLAEEHVEIHPDESYARADLVRVLLATGQDSRAEEALQDGLENEGQTTGKRRLLGNAAWAYLDSGRPARAATLARRAVEMDPLIRDPWLRSPLLQALLREERYDEAEDLLRRELEVRPRDLTLLATRAQIGLRRGDLQAAEAEVRDLLSDGPASAWLSTLLATVLSEEGRFADAETPARRAFAMNPDRSRHALLAWILVAGDLDQEEGVRLAEAALEMPESPTAAADRPPYEPSPEHALGLAYLQQGRHGEAVKLLERAAALQPDRTLIREHLAEARQAAGV
jgi:tetratricopeptide (TPR) repeat protein/TolB-like protein